MECHLEPCDHGIQATSAEAEPCVSTREDALSAQRDAGGRRYASTGKVATAANSATRTNCVSTATSLLNTAASPVMLRNPSLKRSDSTRAAAARPERPCVRAQRASPSVWTCLSREGGGGLGRSGSGRLLDPSSAKNSNTLQHNNITLASQCMGSAAYVW